ncbi:hypothetical protein ACHAWO_008480 [Cyclotella atomus]|uniref:Uncharacterized protein n=1 Tax=Cyclotella atomus TaxID=382360 RepID=A0ABD3QGY1_9STRA
MTGYQGRSSNDTSGSIRNSFHLPEEYNVRGRGRSVQNDLTELVSSRGRSLSMARSSRARSKSRQPAGDRSAITQASASVVSSRGRSSSMAPSRRSSSRATSKARSSNTVASISEETQVRPSRSRSKSRTRSRSRARSQSKRTVQPTDALVPIRQSESYAEDEEDMTRTRSASQARKKSSSSRKFVVEIDEETNDIIGVKELSEDDEPLISSGSGGSERSRGSRGRDMDARRPSRARSRSILRSSHNNSFTSQGERVKFSLGDDLDSSQRSAHEVDRRLSDMKKEERGRSMQNNGRPSKARSLSRQRINFNEVNFDPRGSGGSQGHSNLMEFLKRPDRPNYEQCHSPKRGSISQSNHTEGTTTLTIDEEESDDDSFGYSPNVNSMKHVMHHYTMDDVMEEEEEATVLSECESRTRIAYEPPRSHNARQDPLRHSMPSKATSFKNKLKPVSFNIRAKRQTAPLTGSRESQDTAGTAMSTDDEYERSPLFVNMAADSLMMHQKQLYQEDESRRKAKLRLSRFLNR